MSDEYEIGPIDASEVRAFLDAVAEAFQDDQHDDDMELWSRMVEPERTLVARSGGAIVANSALITMQLAVPGAVAKTAGVSADELERFTRLRFFNVPTVRTPVIECGRVGTKSGALCGREMLA